MKVLSLPILVLMLSLASTCFITPGIAAAAAPTLQATTTNTNTSSGVSTVTCDKPTGTSANELLLAFVINYDDTSATISPPAGWTTARGPDTGNFNSEQITAYVFYKIAGVSEGANYTFTVSHGAYSECAILRYSGVNTSNPLDTASSANTGGGTTRTGLSITTSEDDEVLVMHSAGYGAARTTNPAGMTLRAEWDGVMDVFDETRSTAGATGDRSFDQNLSSVWVNQMVAVRPAQPVTTRIIRLGGRVLIHGKVRIR